MRSLSGRQQEKKFYSHCIGSMVGHVSMSFVLKTSQVKEEKQLLILPCIVARIIYITSTFAFIIFADCTAFDETTISARQGNIKRSFSKEYYKQIVSSILPFRFLHDVTLVAVSQQPNISGCFDKRFIQGYFVCATRTRKSFS